MKIVENASVEIDLACKFQMDVFKLLTPKAGTVDIIFCFPINKDNETSHGGMKECYGKMMQSFQMVSSDTDGRFTCLPDSNSAKFTFEQTDCLLNISIHLGQFF